jgi:DtxR family transcriptional regulator, Mn-dependent transcriptional regulator
VTNDATKATGRTSNISASVGDYLKAIWHIGQGQPVSTGEIARELGVTAPSVTGMLGKLKRDGLIRYQPYRGAELSDRGRSEAMRLIRRHRLLETFLISELGFGWDEVHDEAEQMEHVMSERFTERLAEHLGQPAFDPHGDPIPRSDGSVPQGPDLPLSEAPEGSRFVVHRVLSQEADMLAYVTSLGVVPGAVLRVVAREPSGDLLQARFEKGEQVALSRTLAERILGSVPN